MPTLDESDFAAAAAALVDALALLAAPPLHARAIQAFGSEASALEHVRAAVLRYQEVLVGRNTTAPNIFPELDVILATLARTNRIGSCTVEAQQLLEALGVGAPPGGWLHWNGP